MQGVGEHDAQDHLVQPDWPHSLWTHKDHTLLYMQHSKHVVTPPELLHEHCCKFKVPCESWRSCLTLEWTMAVSSTKEGPAATSDDTVVLPHDAWRRRRMPPDNSMRRRHSRCQIIWLAPVRVP